MSAIPTYGEPSRDDSRLALGGVAVQLDIEAEDTTGRPETVTYILTAYCPCRICCGVWADKRPGGVVYTASGEVAREGVTVAADPDVLPIGTVIEIDGLGQRVVQDTGSAVKGRHIDVYFTDHHAALQFGRQERKIKIVGAIDV